MIVPTPLRRQDKIAGTHGRALAIDGGKRAVAFHDKTQRRLVMTMARRYFAGHDQLQACIQRRGYGRLAAQLRVLQHQHPAHRLFGADELPALQQQRADLLIVPVCRGAVGVRRLRDRWCSDSHSGVRFCPEIC